eukprot:GHVQ01023762.1.p3 GENE.GHVQ01023762.1~~GHVQ01023762.1.p3  ORF type:complete len:108 (-),score=16.12 GHVQ01023762.1:627-950(-)
MPKEERPFYEFTHLICLSTCFKSAPSLSSPKETSVEKRSRKKGGKSAQVDCKDRMDGAADPSNKLDETLGQGIVASCCLVFAYGIGLSSHPPPRCCIICSFFCLPLV